ncbi:MAG: DUF885 domain-containing protein [Rhodothalassiaceae bacterium]
MRVLIAFLFLCLLAPASHATPEALKALFDEEWELRLARDPFLATMEGERRYNSEVPDVSPAAEARAVYEDRALLARLDAIDPDDLNDEDRLDRDLLRFEIEARLRRAAFRPSRIPFLSDSGFHTLPVFVIEATPFDTPTDYEAYIARLRKLGGYIEDNIANMQVGLAEGFTMPRAIMDGILPGFAALAVNEVEKSPFWRPFETLPEGIESETAARLRLDGRNALEEVVLPAYRRLHDFMAKTYLPRARETLGASDLPQGRAMYDMLIRHYTTLDLTADEVHAIGLEEVARIRAEMTRVMEKTGFEGDFAAFLAFLRSDPQFYAKTPEELLMRAAFIAKRIDERLPAYFRTLPRMPYGVRAVPEDIAPNYTTGRYWPPIEGMRGGLYMVNTYALDKRPLYELPALTLHEAVPGHHLQTALASEAPERPRFRQRLYVNAFGEGWGLYAEKLGIEMGLYETPYEEFGRLSYEMWRAGRLVVDTGIHAMGWTREQAIAFFLENSALSEHNIETEVDRYISWPGQALAYKMGERAILALRRKAETMLGEAFDIRDFHDAALLGGSLPLPILEERIDAWIADKRGYAINGTGTGQ